MYHLTGWLFNARQEFILKIPSALSRRLKLTQLDQINAYYGYCWSEKEKASSRQKINDLTYFRIHLEAKCWKFKNKTNVLVFSVLEGKKIINHKHFQIGTFEIYLYWRPGLVFISQVKWSNNSQCVTQDNILRAQTTFMDLKDVKRSL